MKFPTSQYASVFFLLLLSRLPIKDQNSRAWRYWTATIRHVALHFGSGDTSYITIATMRLGHCKHHRLPYCFCVAHYHKSFPCFTQHVIFPRVSHRGLRMLRKQVTDIVSSWENDRISYVKDLMTVGGLQPNHSIPSMGLELNQFSFQSSVLTSCKRSSVAVYRSSRIVAFSWGHNLWTTALKEW